MNPLRGFTNAHFGRSASDIRTKLQPGSDQRQMTMMAPERILSAALRVLHVAAYTTRNWSLNEQVSRKQINDLWEAIHEIPDLLKRWRPDAENELRMHLKEYDGKWPQPNLSVIYEQAKSAQ